MRGVIDDCYHADHGGAAATTSHGDIVSQAGGMECAFPIADEFAVCLILGIATGFNHDQHISY
jgi:hypothetical protein